MTGGRKKRESAQVKGAMRTAVVLLSGGLDSTTLLHYMKQRLGIGCAFALSFDYGQKHSRELEMAQWQAKAAEIEEHRVVDMSFMKELLTGGSALTDEAIEIPDLAQLTAQERSQPPTYVPNRNMMLLSLAAAFAEAKGVADIFYGAHMRDQYGYWDCTNEFLKRMNRLLALNRGKPMTVHAPFIKMGKADVLRCGLEMGLDYARTWSCYHGAARPCGRCPTCVERAEAFRELGLTDPLDG